MTLILYYFNTCPYCIRVLNTIKHLNLSEEIELRNIHEKDAYLAERIAFNLNGKQVPCLLIDGEPMVESADIIDFLEKNQEKIIKS